VFGHPADWGEILRIAERYDLWVIDDACEALGAEYGRRKIGGFGDGAAFAFYPNKQLTTGEGGMIVTNNDEVAALARSLRNQGREAIGAWLEHQHLGYNYRIDEMSAALGTSQMRRLETFMTKRDRVARSYHELLQGSEWIRPPIVKPGVRMSWFVYVVTLVEGVNRGAVMQKLEARGIPTRAYFSPIHLQPYIRSQFGFHGGELPITEDVARRTIALPFHNNLSEGEVEQVVTALVAAVEEAVAEDRHRESLPARLESDSVEADAEAAAGAPERVAVEAH
jgi:perosamine synthetase